MHICVKCKTRKAVYNFYTEDVPMYCISCKLPNMIDTVNYLLTSKINVFEQLRPEFCNECKSTGMIDIKSIICLQCQTNNATYSFPNKNEVIFCDLCKTKNMKKISNKCSGCDKDKELRYNYFN